MSQKTKRKIQIHLRSDIPEEKKALDYLALYGSRTGLEKKLFMQALEAYMSANPLGQGQCIPEPVEQVTEPYREPQNTMQISSFTSVLDEPKPDPEPVQKPSSLGFGNFLVK